MDLLKNLYIPPPFVVQRKKSMKSYSSPPISKGEITEKAKTLVSEIFYDGDIISQMKNI